MSQASQLEGLAIAAQKAWFAAPASLEAKGTFAMRLRHWANETHNPIALAHAAALEQECQQAQA